MTSDEARARLQALGLAGDAVDVLHGHFADAEARGKLGHGFSRIPWLETQSFDLEARPVKQSRRDGIDRWDGAGALGYLTLSAIVDDVLAEGVSGARLVVASPCFPTGALGYWVRRLAAGGLVALLTATSPRRLPPPSGGAPLTGTNPLAIAIPSGDGEPLVADVSMGAVTHGDVIAGRARPEQLVPFGGELAHKAFALAVGLELFVVRARRPRAFGRPSRRASGARSRPRLSRPGGRPAASRRRRAGPSGLSRGPDRLALAQRASRNAWRTTGSIRSSPPTRSSRFATPAQSSSVAWPRAARRSSISARSASSISTQSSFAVFPKSIRWSPKRRCSSSTGRSWSSTRRSTTVSESEAYPRVPLDHEQCGGLLAAAVTAGGLRRGEAVEEPLGERLAGGGEERLHERVDGFRGDEDVALGRVEVGGAAAGPVVAGGAGVRRAPAGRVHDAELALVAALVRRRQELHDLGRAVAGPQQVEPVRPIARVRVGLGRDRADVRGRPRHDRADGQELRLRRHAPLAGVEVAGADRVRRDRRRVLSHR